MSMLTINFQWWGIKKSPALRGILFQMLTYFFFLATFFLAVFFLAVFFLVAMFLEFNG
jgi:hypothetical protein